MAQGGVAYSGGGGVQPDHVQIGGMAPGQGAPYTGQPMAGQPMQPMPGQPGQQPPMMAMPQGFAGCPPGLEYLTQLDQLVVKQQVELLEALTGFETENKYRIFNSLGQQCYFAREKSSCLMRYFCGPGRGFKINITDNQNREVMTIERPFKCMAGCCWCAGSDCCSQVVEIRDSQGQLLGKVAQQASAWSPHYLVYDWNDSPISRIRGPCCTCSCGSDVKFPVTSPDESASIGLISKQWTGFVKEMFTDADTFSVTFPMDMDVRCKAVMLGALFLVDFMHFETSKDNNNH